MLLGAVCPYFAYRGTLEPTTRRQPYVSVQPCLSLCEKPRRQPYVTYVAYVLMYPAVSGTRANSP